MKNAYLEHTNLTVKNPDVLASLLCRLFNWKIRWSGDALDNGKTIHVGGDDSYLALYTHMNIVENTQHNHLTINNINHLGMVVSNLDEVEAKVIAEGFEPINHADYDPGRRFYFLVDDLEIEVVDYS